MAKFGDIFSSHHLGRRINGIHGAEPKDGDKQPTAHGIASHKKGLSSPECQ